MSSTSETGHAKNVANFQKLIDFVTDYGTDYQPSKKNLQLPALTTLKTAAADAISDVLTKNTLYNGKVNDRLEAFKGLRSLSTRLVNALQSTDASPETIKDAKVFNKKIQGKRSATRETPVDPGSVPPNTISTSQQSYDQLIQHFSGLKSLLENEPSYSPNEVDLQITSLDTLTADLTDKNTEVSKSYTKVSNARIARNKTLYTEAESLVETANDVKKYIKSVFGATSPEVAQVKGLEFRKVK